MIEKMKNTLIVTSILYFILGIVMLIFPGLVSDSICYLLALMFLFFGVAGVVMYFKTEIRTPFTSSTLVLAILLGAFGLYIFLNPRVFASIIPLIVGIFLIADAISKLSVSLDLKKINYSGWWHMLIVAFMVLCCGIFLCFNPFKAIELSIMVIGGVLMVDSLSNIFTIYSYSKAEKTASKIVMDAEIVQK